MTGFYFLIFFDKIDKINKIGNKGVFNFQHADFRK